MRVSAVIPAYNVAAWIERAIGSVLEQDADLHELIVVDDGSTDRTPAILSSFSDIKVITQTNRGPSAARNAGAAAVSGDVIVFLDADDELLPNAVRTFERSLTRSSDAGAAVGNYAWTFGDGSERVAWPGLKEVEVLSRKDLSRLIRRNHLIANAAIRREAWHESPFRQDLRACEDQAFWIEMLSRDVPVLMLPEVIVRCTVRREGASTSSTKLMREQRSALFSELSKRPDLSRRERMLARWMGARATMGARVAR